MPLEETRTFNSIGQGRSQEESEINLRIGYLLIRVYNKKGKSIPSNIVLQFQRNEYKRNKC
jgi:hypothetical protein